MVILAKEGERLKVRESLIMQMREELIAAARGRSR